MRCVNLQGTNKTGLFEIRVNNKTTFFEKNKLMSFYIKNKRK